MSDRARLPVAAAALLVLGSASIWLQTLHDRSPLPASNEETLYLTQRATSRVIFAHRPLAADLYWIRAVQYFGGHVRLARARQADPLDPPPLLAAEPLQSFDVLYPLLDIATTLDARFNIAYRFGAIFLSESYPQGPGRPDLALALLQKGVAASPEKWQYWHDIGFVYYWNLHDYLKASDAFRRGADVAGAPWWMRSMAATMLVKGGDRNASRLLWRQMYETANNDYARSAARIKLLQLQAIDGVEQLQRIVDAFVMRTGRPAASWSDLIAAGAIRGVPVDPTGVPYELVSPSRVQVSTQSSLFPLPVEPVARSAT
jgi:hypothetical protein